nr:ATP-binding cassette domain-containing protein [Bacteroidota bacterium]
MDKPKIIIDNLNLHFGRQHILNDINAKIPEKKITVIMGPSGCGKTTLMKSLNRLTDLNPEAMVCGHI